MCVYLSREGASHKTSFRPSHRAAFTDEVVSVEDVAPGRNSQTSRAAFARCFAAIRLHGVPHDLREKRRKDAWNFEKEENWEMIDNFLMKREAELESIIPVCRGTIFVSRDNERGEMGNFTK